MPKTLVRVTCDICGKPYEKFLANVNQNKKYGRKNVCSPECKSVVSALPAKKRTRPIQDRFWEKVDIREDDDCWEWKAALSAGEEKWMAGYFYKGGRMIYAYRVAWELANGREQPKGLEIMHTCDNRRCVNPAHLRLGTHLENMQDCRAKGRTSSGHLRGGKNGNAILNSEQVTRIYERINLGERHADIAMDYSISRSSVTQIARKANWKHLTDELDLL